MGGAFALTSIGAEYGSHTARYTQYTSPCVSDPIQPQPLHNRITPEALASVRQRDAWGGGELQSAFGPAGGFHIEPTASFNRNGGGNDVDPGLSMPCTFTP